MGIADIWTGAQVISSSDGVTHTSLDSLIGSLPLVSFFSDPNTAVLTAAGALIAYQSLRVKQERFWSGILPQVRDYSIVFGGSKTGTYDEIRGKRLPPTVLYAMFKSTWPVIAAGTKRGINSVDYIQEMVGLDKIIGDVVGASLRHVCRQIGSTTAFLPELLHENAQLLVPVGGGR